MIMKSKQARPLRIALVGTRGVPARYGGFIVIGFFAFPSRPPLSEVKTMMVLSDSFKSASFFRMPPTESSRPSSRAA